MCVSCCYNIFPAEDPGEDILDGWEAGRGHHRRINLPVGAGGVFKKRKCYSKKIVHKYSQNRKERMPVMYIQKLYQFSILYLKHLVIQYPKQKSKVTHATVAIIITTAIGGFMLHYTTYMLYFILHKYIHNVTFCIKNYIYIYCI